MGGLTAGRWPGRTGTDTATQQLCPRPGQPGKRGTSRLATRGVRARDGGGQLAAGPLDVGVTYGFGHFLSAGPRRAAGGPAGVKRTMVGGWHALPDLHCQRRCERRRDLFCLLCFLFSPVRPVGCLGYKYCTLVQVLNIFTVSVYFYNNFFAKFFGNFLLGIGRQPNLGCGGL